jgi:hypothetical protein
MYSEYGYFTVIDRLLKSTGYTNMDATNIDATNIYAIMYGYS